MSRFVDYTSRKCYNCEQYWHNKCDGLPDGLESSCTAFNPTRSIEIPLEIERLKTQLKGLREVVIMLIILVIVLNTVFAFMLMKISNPDTLDNILMIAVLIAECAAWVTFITVSRKG
jgi:hypothetical protein